VVVAGVYMDAAGVAYIDVIVGAAAYIVGDAATMEVIAGMPADILR
jgi:hypothetical protein